MHLPPEIKKVFDGLTFMGRPVRYDEILRDMNGHDDGFRTIKLEIDMMCRLSPSVNGPVFAHDPLSHNEHIYHHRGVPVKFMGTVQFSIFHPDFNHIYHQIATNFEQAAIHEVREQLAAQGLPINPPHPEHSDKSILNELFISNGDV